jgi:hypothetical protein
MMQNDAWTMKIFSEHMEAITAGGAQVTVSTRNPNHVWISMGYLEAIPEYLTSTTDLRAGDGVVYAPGVFSWLMPVPFTDTYMHRGADWDLTGAMATAGSAVLGFAEKAANSQVRALAKLQSVSNSLGWGLDYTNAMGKMNALGTGLKVTGNVLGGLNLMISFYQFANAPTIGDKAEYGFDGFMSGIGLVPNAATIGLSSFWSFGGKQLHWNHVNTAVMPAVGMNMPAYSYLPFK